MQRAMKIIYESIMLIMVVFTIITLWTKNTYDSTINWIVWGVFAVDFFIRLFKSKDKWHFIKSNPFLLIAIVPFDQFFQLARIVRVIYLFRIKTIAKYYVSPYITKLSYQSKTFIASILVILLLVISAIILWLEITITNYSNALFATFSHLLFFGRHMFVIERPVSIWLLTGTSILGIIVQGIALQWALTKIEPLILTIRKRWETQKENQNEKTAI